MARSFIRYRTALLSTTFAAGTQTLLTRKAIAHADHYETEQPEQTTSSTDGQQPDLSPEPAASLETDEQERLPANKVDSEVDAMPAVKKSKDKTAIEEIPVAQKPASTSQSGLFAGFSLGLGESLLALLIAGPFVLRIWKKRFQ